jgi:hypothetical protein
MIEDLIEKLSVLLEGKIPSKISVKNPEDKNERKLAEMMNQLIDFFREIHEFIIPLSRGELHDVSVQANNFLASPFKELHSRLLHLTWQAKQVAARDYGQRDDYMGDFSQEFNEMIVALDHKEKLLNSKICELENALAQIKTLRGLLPICSHCKKIRNDKGYWEFMEIYIRDHTEADFSHGICPECMERFYPEHRKKS